MHQRTSLTEVMKELQNVSLRQHTETSVGLSHTNAQKKSQHSQGGVKLMKSS